MVSQFDVVVVGAGPAGSVSATLLSRKGYRVALIDRAHFPREKTCAEYMSPGVSDVLARLAIPAMDVPQATWIEGMEVVSPRGRVLRVNYHDDSGRTLYACTIPRRHFDARLLEQAALSGALIMEATIAREPIVVGDRVTGVRVAVGGREVDVTARLTVVADGARSTLARALGISRSPRWPRRLGLVAHYSGTSALRGAYGQMHVRSAAYCGVAPMSDGSLNVALVVAEDALRRSGLTATQYFDRWVSTDDEIRALLRDSVRVTRVRGLLPVGARSIRASVAGALLVGDAAGFFDPFTGEGIYRALRGAELAAAVGDAALASGELSSTALGQYDVLRRAVFRDKEHVTRLVQLFVQYPRLMEYALPRLAERGETARVLGLVLGDVAAARRFRRPAMLWSALHP